jgi:Protein of unknown function (DUF3089)
MYKVLLVLVLGLLGDPAEAPDYADPENWAALPLRKDAADWVPESAGLRDNQDSALADVFFIHPTTDLYGLGGNANIEKDKLNNITDKTAVKYQASVFNGSCKVYAPRYRQAALHNFFKKNSAEAQESFDLAYSDVKKAFEYYLEHYNNGRPIVIAGHSQGSKHAARLLQDFFDGTPLQQQLVLAYVIGFPTRADQFQFLKVSTDSNDVGGIVSFSTFGMDPPLDRLLNDYNGAICVNPLSWTADKEFIAAKYHLGGISREWDGVQTKLIGAKCGNGILEIQKPAVSGYVPLLKYNYHLHDYTLFYMNIRENAEHRVQRYLEKNKRP